MAIKRLYFNVKKRVYKNIIYIIKKRKEINAKKNILKRD